MTDTELRDKLKDYAKEWLQPKIIQYHTTDGEHYSPRMADARKEDIALNKFVDGIIAIYDER